MSHTQHIYRNIDSDNTHTADLTRSRGLSLNGFASHRGLSRARARPRPPLAARLRKGHRSTLNRLRAAGGSDGSTLPTNVPSHFAVSRHIANVKRLSVSPSAPRIVCGVRDEWIPSPLLPPRGCRQPSDTTCRDCEILREKSCERKMLRSSLRRLSSSARPWKVAVLPGDGIGPEVTPPARTCRRYDQ